MSILTPRLALIIDDDLVTRVALQDYLAEAGIEAIEAVDGLEGIEKFEERGPDIILLDVSMPGIDGFETCRRLRATETGGHVPILMMTGHDDVASVDRSYESGATDFVSKPMNFPLLIHRLRYLLRAKETGDQLRVSEESLEKAQRIAKMGSWEYNLASGEFTYSKQVERLFDCDGVAKPLTLDALLRAICKDERELVVDEFRRALRGKNAYDVDFNLQVPDGSSVRIHQETDFETDATGAIVKAFGTFQDITESWEAERKIRKIAFFDNVTGLPNRTYFMQRISEMLALARRNESFMALMFVDLDQFKRVNDSWGHHAGDALLRQVSLRLQDSLRRCDTMTRAGDPRDETFARLGGDEFVLLLPQIRRAEDAGSVARRLLEEFKQPFHIEQSDIHVSASVGISIYPSDGTDENTLLKYADIAMYQVKEAGRNGFRFYAPDMNTRTVERLNLETSLWRALENDEFILHYQPKIDVKSGTVVGAESLVRWRHPTIGLVSPAEFIPVAEECGLIVPLGKWVLDESCRQAALWNEKNGCNIQISVNISAAQLQREDLIETIRVALHSAGLGPASLQIELTESTLMRDTEKNMEVLNGLRDMGVDVAIDDFGTGYSSLSYLKRLPINCLKIDRSFVHDMTIDERDAAIVRGTIALAHNLELNVVAEGVETADQNEMLREFGCDEVQGYLFSPALPATEFIQWVHWFAERSIGADIDDELNRDDCASNSITAMRKVGPAHQAQ
jgi:diguanylate cyclase (GGDEF)-like protein